MPHRSEPPHGGDTLDTSLLAESDCRATEEANITRGARNVCGIAPDGKDVALPQLYGIAPKKTNGGNSPTLRYCALKKGRVRL